MKQVTPYLLITLGALMVFYGGVATVYSGSIVPLVFLVLVGLVLGVIGLLLLSGKAPAK